MILKLSTNLVNKYCAHRNASRPSSKRVAPSCRRKVLKGMMDMRDRHMQMGSSTEDNRLFGGHSNPEQRSRPRMPLSSGEERLPRADRK